MNYSDVKNPKWANAENSVIDCEVDFDDLVEEYVPFTASPNDFYGHGKEIYERCLAGDFGPVLAYQPPPEPTQEQKEFTVRTNRNNLLAELDAVVSNPLRWNSYSSSQKQEISTYRQSLLDVPQQASFPDSIDWPVFPL